MAKSIARAIQTAVGADVAMNCPNPTWTEFYQPTGVKAIAGSWAPLVQGAIGNSKYADPTDARRGVWVSDPTESWELDSRRNAKEMAVLWGIYDGGYPTNPTAGVYDHQFVLDLETANRIFFTTIYEDDDGGRYVHTGHEPASLKITGAEGYVSCDMQFYGQHLCHAQFTPTYTGVGQTFDGRLFVRNSSLDSDAAAETWNIAVDTLGAIDGATAKVKTKHSTDAAFAAAQTVSNNKPFKLLYGSGGSHGFTVNDESGLEAVFTIGSAGAGNALVATDTWTVSTRGTAPTVTIPTGYTVYVPRKYEATVLLGGTAPRKAPKVIEFNINRGILNNNHGWSKDIAQNHPVGDGFLITGSLQIETEDQQFLHYATNLVKTSLKVTFEGDYIGATGYTQIFEIDLTNVQIDRVDRDLLKNPRTPVVTVPFTFKPTTVDALTGAKLRIRNGVANLRS